VIDLNLKDIRTVSRRWRVIGLLIKKTIAFSLLMLSFTTASNAAVQVISSVPTSWRLQDYVGSVVTVWYTSSPCTNGNLSFPASSTQAEINRFWALILAAKLSNHGVYVYYDDTSAPATCTVMSFGMDG